MTCLDSCLTIWPFDGRLFGCLGCLRNCLAAFDQRGLAEGERLIRIWSGLHMHGDLIGFAGLQGHIAHAHGQAIVQSHTLVIVGILEFPNPPNDRSQARK